MSVRVMSWVFARSKAKGVTRLVLLAIGDHAHDTGRNAYPSMTTLMDKTGLDKRTVQRALRILVELGELTIELNAGPKGTNRYHVHVPKGWRTDTGGGTAPPAERHPPGQSATGTAPPPPAESHPGQPASGTAPGGVAEMRAGGGTAPPEPSLNQTTSNPSQPLGERNATSATPNSILALWVRTAQAQGLPTPDEAQRLVTKSARSLIAQGYDDAHILETAAINAARDGQTNLGVQMTIDARRTNPTTRSNGHEATSDQRVRTAVAAGEALKTELAGRRAIS